MSDEKKKKERKKRKPGRFFLFLFGLIGSFGGTFAIGGGIDSLILNDFVKEYKTFNVSIDAKLDEEIKGALTEILSSVVFGEKKRFNIVSEGAEFNITWKEGEGFFTEHYVPVSHLYAVTDDLNSTKQKIYVAQGESESVKEILRGKYSTLLETEDVSKVLDKTGKNAAFVGISKLSFNTKLLKYESKYFLDDLAGGIPIGIGTVPDSPFVDNIVKKNATDEFSALEFDSTKVGTINQTGVTALTRALASKINASGDWGYASNKIAKFLADADITHVSNEISFVPGCVPTMSMRFCSRPDYIESLVDSGVDIVELTGNHNNDYGSQFNTSTIKTYAKKGWQYFGGGLNTADSEKIAYVDVKDTKVAFIGYNYYDTMLGTLALAGTNRAGSNSYSDAKLKRDIEAARKVADIVIVDFQFQECYSYPDYSAAFLPCYKPMSSPDQVGTFRKAVTYGADIVVGTQAHQPQTYEIYKGKLIFYGLGNLFFDQAYWVGTRHGIVLTHYFYNGKLIQTKLTTTNYNLSLQTYVSSGSERTQLLQYLYNARTGF